MTSFIRAFIDWLKSLFFKEEMELTIVGIQNSGKTTLLHVLTSGKVEEDMIPTVGFNMRKVTKQNVTMKLWDLGGQPRFRNMWERYCRGVDAIIFVLDAADPTKLEPSLEEFQNLLYKPQLTHIPVLVLGNKIDLAGALTADEISEKFGLSKKKDREIGCYSISAKEGTNIDITLNWLLKHTKSRNRTAQAASTTATTTT